MQKYKKTFALRIPFPQAERRRGALAPRLEAFESLRLLQLTLEIAQWNPKVNFMAVDACT